MINQNTALELWEYRDNDLWWKEPKRGRQLSKPAGAKHKTGYRQVRLGDQRYYVHRIIFLMERGYLPEYPREVHHRNKIKDDNRIENLVDVSKAQNQQDRAKFKNNKSGYKGVTWHKLAGKWRAEIRANGKAYHLGLFLDPETAHQAYCKAANEYHKEYDEKRQTYRNRPYHDWASN